MIVLLTLTSFLGAFLLFAIQPLIAKLLLPHLGGAPAVWNTSMVFFQAALLAGYAYAHRLAQAVGDGRRQYLVHGALLLAGLTVLPPILHTDWIPAASANPILPVLALLAAAVGLPFLALSATAPLVQRWLAGSPQGEAENPYFLYAASNLGSFSALLAYPFLIEPWLDLPTQAVAWTAGYVLLIPLMGAAALVTRAGPVPAPPATQPPGPLPRLRWVLLALAPSSQLLGVTTHITTDIAAVPLLWVVPLAVYLLTFAIAFARRPFPPREAVLRLEALLVPLLGMQIFWSSSQPAVSIPFHLATLFAVALACHGELVRLRPAPARLTEFYLWISFGGVLGGAFNALAAPLLFSSPLEYPLALLLAAFLRPGVWPRDVRSWAFQGGLPVVLAALLALAADDDLPGLRFSDPSTLAFLALALAAAVAAYANAGRPLLFAGCTAALMAGGWTAQSGQDEVVARVRSFFGIHRVTRTDGAAGTFHVLANGSTFHGAQDRSPAGQSEPLAYYGRSGPLGQAFDALAPARHVALVGLGTGSSLCHRAEGRRWTIYEIDPTVVDMARDARLFSFFGQCAPDAAVVPGDARRRLAESAPGAFDLLILDAFSSDAIPVHLLTREAMAVYWRTLAEGGVLAFHLSNRYLDLEPLIAALAADAGLSVRWQEYNPDREESARRHTPSNWAVLARRDADLGRMAADPRWRLPVADPAVEAWTDTRSDLATLLIRGRK
ncbi:MAG: fused MFS/spermidine synthase [Magnetospirillum sp. WYHS-4]